MSPILCLRILAPIALIAPPLSHNFSCPLASCSPNSKPISTATASSRTQSHCPGRNRVRLISPGSLIGRHRKRFRRLSETITT
ncbi:hypothetical protein ACI65C_008672 [Semiaphis heraclei]